MNAPAKVGIQLAWIATMIFLTAELRCSLDKAQPRRYLTSACIALFANACAISCVLPVLLKTTENLHGTRMLAFSALCLGCLIYIAYRLAAFTAFCNQPPKEDPVEAQADGEIPAEDPETPSQESPVETTQEIFDPITDTNTDPEQTQGKDDQQDGSQQQDPMAS